MTTLLDLRHAEEAGYAAGERAYPNLEIVPNEYSPELKNAWYYGYLKAALKRSKELIAQMEKQKNDTD